VRVAVFATSILLGAAAAAAPPSFEQRVEAQRRIDAVHLSHQLGPSRSVLEAVPRAVLEEKVRTYLRQSRLLEARWHAPITRRMLERELERMVRSTRMPERLRELFAALDDDPVLIAECLARPALADRLARGYFAAKAEQPGWDDWWPAVASGIDIQGFEPHDGLVDRLPDLRDLDAPPCLPDDTWHNGSLDLPAPLTHHTAVWTGSEMIVWGGFVSPKDSGARYDPATDTWSALAPHCDRRTL
jgi:hypothetical protein